jgi:tRNA uridine 5-carboxymethylaminomethyl modification enzyme
VDGRSLDYSKMEEQPGDDNPSKFSYLDITQPLKEQRSCFMTYTSLEVHDVLREGFDRSPMFTGRIKSIGPRYCPSIEDKINRFADKERHQIFVEPEGWNTCEIYVNGFSTSLPQEIQAKALRMVSGFENAKIFRPGYAIEYDYFPPTQLKHTLETKLVEGLFFAGQINGTTGYEEAASQGLIAGMNAHLKINEKEPFILRRDQAYIGVLIDDLITKGTEEPYRMFTSRAEYRTLLRQDNADFRLTPLSYNLGLATEERLKRMEYKLKESENFVQFFKETSLKTEEANPILEVKGSSLMTQPDKMFKVFSRPQIDLEDILKFDKVQEYIKEHDLDEEVIEQAEIQVKYSGYIEKEKNNADKLNRLEDVKIPENFDYDKIVSISIESREKLKKIKPVTISQASRISGVTPTDISILLIHMGR